MTDIARIDPKDAQLAAHAATTGDLANLTNDQRTALYGSVCASMGLNPLSRPFEYIKLNNRLTLYATRTATDQLRKINGVSITAVDQVVDDGVLIVTVQAQDATGRTDMEIGAVTIANLKGEALANARMKAITKAKRRVTLSISGLGWMDETEVATVPSAQPVRVDMTTGEVTEPAPIRPISQTDAIGDLYAAMAEYQIPPESVADWAYDKHQVQTVEDAPSSAVRALVVALGNDRERARFLDKYPPVGADVEVIEMDGAG